HITDWDSELSPWYDQASRMLGVAQNPYFSPSDKAMKQVADQMGVGHTFTLAPLGVYFGDGAGVKSKDPFFGGVGADRDGCLQCGGCMTGCRHNAKNTLPKNYLGLAEKFGAKVFAEHTVVKTEKLSDGSWKVTARKSSAWFGGKRVFTASKVVVAAGTYNTQKLLHKMKNQSVLPKLSDQLGRLSRTNSEALTGSIMPKGGTDFSKGSAITSSFFPDDHTHVEPVRYGKGSNFMGLLQTVMTDGTNIKVRRKQWLRQVITKPSLVLKILDVRKWSERTVVALIMQNVDSAISVKGKKGLFGFRLTSKNDSLTPNATYIPAANEVARRIAENNGGIAGGHIGDLVNAPFTAHFVGGCVIGDSASTGVIDPYHRVYNYPTLHVVDGASVTANLGVNPSLTITAQAERAFSMWPNKGEADLRPAQNSPYKRVEPVMPNHTVVPKGAVGELRVS
ncbi:MAG: GMC oxidoreductase, partial [Candidatus Nanopelagicus sp.]